MQPSAARGGWSGRQLGEGRGREWLARAVRCSRVEGEAQHGAWDEPACGHQCTRTRLFRIACAVGAPPPHPPPQQAHAAWCCSTFSSAQTCGASCRVACCQHSWTPTPPWTPPSCHLCARTKDRPHERAHEHRSDNHNAVARCQSNLVCMRSSVWEPCERREMGGRRPHPPISKAPVPPPCATQGRGPHATQGHGPSPPALLRVLTSARPPSLPHPTLTAAMIPATRMYPK